MNYLAFNPKSPCIEEWRDLYVSKKTIKKINETYDQCEESMKILANTLPQQQRQSLFVQQLSFRETLVKKQSKRDQDIQQILSKIANNKKQLQIQLKGQVMINHEAQHQIQINKPVSTTREQLCGRHIRQLKDLNALYLQIYLQKSIGLIQNFVILKIGQVKTKHQKQKLHLSDIRYDQRDKPQGHQTIQIIYFNLFIQAHYLVLLVQHNTAILQKKGQKSQSLQLNNLYQIYLNKLTQILQKLEALQAQLKETYLLYFNKKKFLTAVSQKKQQEYILSQIAVNASQYESTGTIKAFSQGFIIAFLIFSLLGIVIFRSLNASVLEKQADYLQNFRVWRGASYLIFCNWIMVIVLSVFNRLKINYKLIMIDRGCCLAKPQSFFMTASLLTAIYLILFLVFTLKNLEYIQGYQQLNNLGYYMWIINVVFMINPVKVLNYSSRKFFVSLIIQAFLSFVINCNFNRMTITKMFSSWTQPVGDLYFTLCVATQGNTNCSFQSQVASYVFMLIFCSLRIRQCISMHQQFAKKRLSRPMMGMIHAFFTINTVTASFLFNYFRTADLETYWIVSASISGLTGFHTDVRVDWGLIGHDKQDKMLRKNVSLPRVCYIVIIVIDMILNAGWVLNVSNNIAANVGINPIYFLMIVSYIEQFRRGLWFFMVVQEIHSNNIGNLKALNSDQSLYLQLGITNTDLQISTDSNKTANKYGNNQKQIQLKTISLDHNLKQDLIQNQNISQKQKIASQDLKTQSQKVIQSTKISLQSVKQGIKSNRKINENALLLYKISKQNLSIINKIYKNSDALY